ncbi:AEC family transporter [Rhodovibrionaceae bacterium A322]
MLDIILVILPVFLLIAVGYGLRKKGFPGEGFWAPAEKLTYFVALPALIIAVIAKADFTSTDILPFSGTLMGSILIMTGLALALKPLFGVDGPGFTSLYQAIIRMNTYIGLSVSYGLFGEEGLLAAALATASIVPLANILCVTMLARFGTASQPTLMGVLKLLLRNPLFMACITGALLNASGIGLPPVLGDMLDILARCALPLGLLAVGAALNIRSLKESKGVAVSAVGLKLLLLPVITWGVGTAAGLSEAELGVVVLYNGLPTATSSYILARQLGGDAPLMANLTTVQTLLSMLTIPLILWPFV